MQRRSFFRTAFGALLVSPVCRAVGALSKPVARAVDDADSAATITGLSADHITAGTINITPAEHGMMMLCDQYQRLWMLEHSDWQPLTIAEARMIVAGFDPEDDSYTVCVPVFLDRINDESDPLAMGEIRFRRWWWAENPHRRLLPAVSKAELIGRRKLDFVRKAHRWDGRSSRWARATPAAIPGIARL